MNQTLFPLLLALKDGPRQANDLLDRMRELIDARPSLASFYRLLKSGLDEGWLEVIGTDTEGPGRPRQIYALTAGGTAAVEAEARRLQALAELALG